MMKKTVIGLVLLMMIIAGIPQTMQAHAVEDESAFARKVKESQENGDFIKICTLRDTLDMIDGEYQKLTCFDGGIGAGIEPDVIFDFKRIEDAGGRVERTGRPWGDAFGSGEVLKIYEEGTLYKEINALSYGINLLPVASDATDADIVTAINEEVGIAKDNPEYNVEIHRYSPSNSKIPDLAAANELVSTYKYYLEKSGYDEYSDDIFVLSIAGPSDEMSGWTFVTAGKGAKVVKSLEITKLPDKVDYRLNEMFDPSGGVVTVNYSDGSTEKREINEMMYLKTPDMSAEGTSEIGVQYKGKVAFFSINIADVDGEFDGFKIVNKVNGHPITWECDAEGTLNITGQGTALIMDSEYGDIFESYKKNIKKVIVNEGITEIWTDTFKECVNLTEVMLPKGLTKIHENVFEGCISLESIVLPESITEIGYNAFKNCSGLSEIEILEGTEYILRGAFNGCSSLKSVTLPESVNYIDEGVFQGCPEDCTYYVYKDSFADSYITFGNKEYIEGDTEAPVIEDVSVDNKDVTVGDEVTVTVKAADESEIKDGFRVSYSMGSQIKSATMKKVEEGVYEGIIKITNDFVNGEYFPSNTRISDIKGNSALRLLTSFKDASFKVSGCIEDAEAPELISLKLNKDEAVLGNRLTYELVLRDDSGFSGIAEMVCKANDNYKKIKFDTSTGEMKGNTITIKGMLEIDGDFSFGEYAPLWLTDIEDIYGNSQDIYNISKKVQGLEFYVYSKPEYLEISKLNNVTVITEDRDISDTKIEGDLYIGEDASVDLKNVKVTGNIYVMGGLNAISIDTNVIKAKSFYFGRYGYRPIGGKVYLSGTNRIVSTSASDQILTDLPLNIEKELKSIDGKIGIMGVTVDVADLYINGEKIATENGKFVLDDFDIGEAESLIFSWKSNYGNVKKKEYTVERYVTSTDGNLNAVPVIDAKNQTYCIGSQIDYMSGVRAIDKEDGEISERIIVDHSKVNIEQNGKYEVKYSVSDLQGVLASKTIYITISKHSFNEWKTEKEATCEREGKEKRTCEKCGYEETRKIDVLGHKWDEGKVTVKATCIKEGEKCFSCTRTGCDAQKKEVIDALGHNWDKEFTVDKEATCTDTGSKSKHCMNEGCEEKAEITAIKAKGHISGERIVTEATFFHPGSIIVKCENCKKVIEKETLYYNSNIERYAGDNRYETAMLTADALKSSLNSVEFENIIVASGDDYADALAGSYLAKVKKAPVLLVNMNQESSVKNYISKNLKKNGTVYLLGGEAAVSGKFEKSLKSMDVKRLGGANRYETNMKILRETGVKNEDILVCTGMDFADSLSASAVGKPIVLTSVRGLNDSQKAYLRNVKIKDVYLIGGTGAVSNSVGNQFKIYDDDGKVRRISGANRYETSTEIAEKFFPGGNEIAVLAYAMDFPDGLSGGPLAMSLDAPLLLVDGMRYSDAAEYVRNAEVEKLVVMGGDTLIPETVVNKIIN